MLRKVIPLTVLGFLCLLHWSPFLFTKVDMWHAQGQFVHLSVLLMFCYTLFIKPKEYFCVNVPLALFVLWAGICVISKNYKTMQSEGYAIASIAPFFNFITIILFYKICVQYLNRADVTRIIKYLKYSVITIIVFCILQKFGLSQFIKEIEGVFHPQREKIFITAFIGHPTHLAAYLAMCLPLFFEKKLSSIIWSVVIWIILIFFTGMSHTISLTGIVVGTLVTLYMIYKHSFKIFLIIIFIMSIIILYFFASGRIDLSSELFSNSGRFGAWKFFFNKFKSSFVTGLGFGSVRLFNYKTGTTIFHHLHNEFFQVGVELGFIGLIALIYCVVDFFKLKVNESVLNIKIKALFIGFILSCMFNWTAHLWVVGTQAMFFYASLYIINKEELEEKYYADTR